MRDTEERTALILRRTREARRAREKRGSAALAALCCSLCLGLAGVFRALADGGGAGYVPGFYGSALLLSGAGGYVLAGVLAFTAGVVVTVVCIRSRKKREKEEQHQEELK